ncbi:uncharacterized protein BT62DRAFT_769123 [Guyanagaster necrorhizus]|uniref:Secreted protein n=1 Tax=Guyanagaster necrorhizus TaxID=856835 RepID=A0A9P7VEW8_9AGAR|nr:uncharacterized protein BT62DRAFT_769123 [Guyanagaster necrorhizus MCA 3950]KAG7439298.1 hypothetical protein BT62DRAFT_769123 [Guyanagaster necrorhizus MCA 3950]
MGNRLFELRCHTVMVAVLGLPRVASTFPEKATSLGPCSSSLTAVSEHILSTKSKEYQRDTFIFSTHFTSSAPCWVKPASNTSQQHDFATPKAP